MQAYGQFPSELAQLPQDFMSTEQLDDAQMGLAGLGLIPGPIGIGADLIDMATSLGRGDYGYAALAGLAAIPGLGMAFAGRGALKSGIRAGSELAPLRKSDFGNAGYEGKFLGDVGIDQPGNTYDNLLGSRRVLEQEKLRKIKKVDWEQLRGLPPEEQARILEEAGIAEMLKKEGLGSPFESKTISDTFGSQTASDLYGPTILPKIREKGMVGGLYEKSFPSAPLSQMDWLDNQPSFFNLNKGARDVNTVRGVKKFKANDEVLDDTVGDLVYDGLINPVYPPVRTIDVDKDQFSLIQASIDEPRQLGKTNLLVTDSQLMIPVNPHIYKANAGAEKVSVHSHSQGIKMESSDIGMHDPAGHGGHIDPMTGGISGIDTPAPDISDLRNIESKLGVEGAGGGSAGARSLSGDDITEAEFSDAVETAFKEADEAADAGRIPEKQDFLLTSERKGPGMQVGKMADEKEINELIERIMERHKFTDNAGEMRQHLKSLNPDELREFLGPIDNMPPSVITEQTIARMNKRLAETPTKFRPIQSTERVAMDSLDDLPDYIQKEIRKSIESGEIDADKIFKKTNVDVRGDVIAVRGPNGKTHYMEVVRVEPLSFPTSGGSSGSARLPAKPGTNILPGFDPVDPMRQATQIVPVPKRVSSPLRPGSGIEIVSDKAAHDVKAMRGGGGKKHMNNTNPGEDGWLGNPHKWKGNGGTGTVDNAIAKFKADFLKKVKSDPVFREQVLNLRGKRIGYYKPNEKNHVRVIQNWLKKFEPKEKLKYPPGVLSKTTPSHSATLILRPAGARAAGIKQDAVYLKKTLKKDIEEFGGLTKIHKYGAPGDRYPINALKKMYRTDANGNEIPVLNLINSMDSGLATAEGQMTILNKWSTDDLNRLKLNIERTVANERKFMRTVSAKYGESTYYGAVRNGRMVKATAPPALEAVVAKRRIIIDELDKIEELKGIPVSSKDEIASSIMSLEDKITIPSGPREEYIREVQSRVLSRVKDFSQMGKESQEKLVAAVMSAHKKSLEVSPYDFRTGGFGEFAGTYNKVQDKAEGVRRGKVAPLIQTPEPHFSSEVIKVNEFDPKLQSGLDHVDLMAKRKKAMSEIPEWGNLQDPPFAETPRTGIFPVSEKQRKLHAEGPAGRNISSGLEHLVMRHLPPGRGHSASQNSPDILELLKKKNK